MTAAEALSRAQVRREIAAKAKADARTVERVLRGEGPRNSAWERVAGAMVALEIEQATVSDDSYGGSSWSVFGENGEHEVEFIKNGEAIGVYVLVDPRDRTVRYVGATEDGPRRLTAHLAEQSANKAKWEWIEELRVRELRPIMIVIEVAPRKTAHLAEEKWISAYQKNGTLYNQKVIGYPFRLQRFELGNFRGMPAASLAKDGIFVTLLSKATGVRAAAVKKTLAGQEVWPETYWKIKEAASNLDVTDVPPSPARASRRGSCATCAAKNAECSRLTAERDFARDEVATLRGIVGELRARVAELEAAATPAPAPAVAPPVAKQAPTPPARLAMVPRERIVTIEMPDGTLATG